MKHLIFALAILLSSTVSRAQTSEWEPMNRGLLHLLVYTIEVDPVDSLVMYCGTEYGNLYKTTDGGFNWILSRDGITTDFNSARMTALFLDRLDRNLIYAGYSSSQSKKNLFRSTNAGSFWELVQTPDSWGSGGIGTFYKSYGSPGRLYCGLGWRAGIYISSNKGETWEKTLASCSVQVISGHRDQPDLVFAGTSDQIGYPTPLLKSLDGGKTWSNAMANIPKSNTTGVRAIAFSPQNRDIVYVGVTGPGRGLYVSNSQGEHWEKLLDVGEISEIAIHPANNLLIYLSTVADGVFRTTDGGVTWQQYSLGLPKDPIMRVCIAAGYPIRVFAVTLRHGIYRLVDEELPPQ